MFILIFVTLGTQDKAFDRLILELSKIKDEEIFVQSGYTVCPDTLAHKDYLDEATFEMMLDKADIIITHAGVGSIIQALKRGKKILAVPRLAKYSEHTNDHQLEIAKKFKEEGHILVLNDGDDINEKIKELKNFTPRPFISNRDKFLEKLDELIRTI